jgi:hypothetical protein
MPLRGRLSEFRIMPRRPPNDVTAYLVIEDFGELPLRRAAAKVRLSAPHPTGPVAARAGLARHSASPSPSRKSRDAGSRPMRVTVFRADHDPTDAAGCPPVEPTFKIPAGERFCTDAIALRAQA